MKQYLEDTNGLTKCLMKMNIVPTNFIHKKIKYEGVKNKLYKKPDNEIKLPQNVPYQNLNL